MRIIDNKHDFYDYLQDPTDIIVFDRRDSFELTKDFLCSRLYETRQNEKSGLMYIQLQCGVTHWLFVLEVTFTGFSLRPDKDFKVHLVDTWKDYDSTNELIKLTQVEFNMFLNRKSSRIGKDLDSVLKNKSYFVDELTHNNAKIVTTLSNYRQYNRDRNMEDKFLTVPLLKSSGLASLIDPVQIFTAIEEYFSIEKTKSETTEAKGTTNDDKITMHGFDLKTSFRGKNK